MLTIRQTENGWELCRDGQVLTVEVEGVATSTFARYEDAVGVIAAMLAATNGVLAVDEAATSEDAVASDGLLPETWTSPADGGIAFCQETGDGRDFTNCVWDWRDPASAFVPLMLQTETEWGHYGATLAGFATELRGGGNDTVGGSGRFYDSEAGRQFRDMLLGSRRFTVSVDPGAVTWEDECLEVDDDGWCASWRTNFLTYTIIGITGTPFAGFENASIELGAAEAIAASGAAPHGCGCGSPTACTCSAPHHPELSTRRPHAVPLVHSSMVASGGIVEAHPNAPRLPDAIAAATAFASPLVDVPLMPPAAWFDSPQFVMPTPLTITNQGRVMSHVALSASCHTGYVDRCVTPPMGADYLDFLTGGVITDDGERRPTGALTWGIPHADLDLDLLAAQSHYADSRHGWADVTVGVDRHGIWISGALRPGLTEADVRILRALALSGDWRYSHRTGDLSMMAALAVNNPGFPIIASGGVQFPMALPRQRVDNGQVLALVASGVVPQQARREPTDALAERLAVLERYFAADQRSRLASIRREVARERLGV